MRVLIVGGTGFVGKALVDFACARGSQIGLTVAVASRNRPERDAGVEWFCWDVMNKAPVLPHFDAIIHAAAPVSVEMNLLRPGQMYEQIFEGARNVAELCARQARPSHLLYLSSGAVYGEMPVGISSWREDSMLNLDPFRRGNAYALGKVSAETFLSITSAEAGFPLTIARLFAFSGPHLPLEKHFAVGNFVRDALKGGPIYVRGTGREVRSYLDSRDMAEWICAALGRTEAYGKIIHIGSPHCVSVRDVALEVSRLSGALWGSPIEVVVQGKTTPFDGLNRYVPSTDVSESILAVSQRFSLTESLETMMEP